MVVAIQVGYAPLTSSRVRGRHDHLFCHGGEVYDGSCSRPESAGGRASWCEGVCLELNVREDKVVLPRPLRARSFPRVFPPTAHWGFPYRPKFGLCLTCVFGHATLTHTNYISAVIGIAEDTCASFVS